MRRYRLHLAIVVCVAALVAVFSPVVPWTDQASADRSLARAQLAAPPTTEARRPPTTTTSTTEPPTTTTTAPPTTTTTAPPTTTTTAPPTTTTAPVRKFTMEPYRGLGAWIDVYDWTTTYAKHAPALEPSAVDALAAHGVQTIFIQASKWDAPEAVLEPARLQAWIDRAHAHGMSVVAWYLPTLVDPAMDLHRLRSIAGLNVDGLAIDIEARNVPDVAERNRRLVDLSATLRSLMPGEVIGAIPLEPVLIEDVNPSYWPGFPWAELAPHYDVWLPMGYWTNRRGEWRNAHAYTAANIDRIRARIGRPDAPVHPIGGIGDTSTVEDIVAFHQAATERGVIGGSIYDYRTTQAPFWEALAPFRALRP